VNASLVPSASVSDCRLTLVRSLCPSLNLIGCTRAPPDHYHHYSRSPPPHCRGHDTSSRNINLAECCSNIADSGTLARKRFIGERRLRPPESETLRGGCGVWRWKRVKMEKKNKIRNSILPWANGVSHVDGFPGTGLIYERSTPFPHSRQKTL